MLTQTAIAMLGAFVYLRIVAKEKNRRERHLLLRVAECKRIQEEQRQEQLIKESFETAAQASASPESPPVATFTGETAAAA